MFANINNTLLEAASIFVQDISVCAGLFILNTAAERFFEEAQNVISCEHWFF